MNVGYISRLLLQNKELRTFSDQSHPFSIDTKEDLFA